MTSAVDLDLPHSLTARPLTLADVEAVTAVIAAEEVVDLGAPEMTVEEVLSDWQRPGYDIATSTVGVFDGDRLVAYADLSDDVAAYTAVHPHHRGRGIGTALARWLQRLARTRGSTLIASQVPSGSPADRLLADLGYVARWTAWDLELPEGAEIRAQPLAEGYSLRDSTPEDHEPAYHVIEDAFTEWAGRDRVPLEDFAARVWRRPGFEPWNLRLVEGPDGELVGATHVHLAGEAGYVARIAVRRDQRGQGLARAMLADAFGLARAHGAVRCYLSTDTRAGARDLYERVGMVVTSTWVNRAITL